MKKIHAYWWRFTSPSLTKLLKIMKLISILLFVCALSVHAGGFSQDVKINLTLNGVKLTSFFKAIEKKTQYRFTFCNDILPSGKVVYINVKETLVSQVMMEVMAATNLKYRFVEQSGIFIISVKDDQSEKAEAPMLRTVSGTVVSAQGEPLTGVSVQAKGSNKATTTGANGAFSIDVEDNVKTLVFSFVGMITREVNIEGKSSIQVTLQIPNKALDEVVVVGYGTQRRALVTGAVASVNSKTLNEVPSLSISQALQGRISGLQVTNNGSPGTQPIVRIRGISSISFASDPVYVVDGFSYRRPCNH